MMKLRVFNKSNLQFIAIIAMAIDHMSFLAPSLSLYYVMRFVGRITVIIMSYFVAEGFYKTRDVYKYIIRMAVFAAAAQIPFYLFEHGANIPHDIVHILSGLYYGRNVIFTLLVGLCLLTILKTEKNMLLKILAFLAAWRLVRSSDWRYFCLLWVVLFGLLHGRRSAQMTAAAAVVFLRVIVCGMPIISAFVTAISPSETAAGLFAAIAGHINGGQPTYWTLYFSLAQLGGLLAIPLLLMYNGEKGNAPRLGFYIFYPAHLLVLFLIKILIA